MKKMLKLKKLLIVMLVAGAICAAGLLLINAFVVGSTKPQIVFKATRYGEYSQDEFAGLTELTELGAECILVLGAGLKPDGTPNHMLEDRLLLALELYRQGVAPKLLLSGDHGQKHYDEVNAMRIFMEENGVPKEDIFLDHAGFSTYESVYRSKAVFKVSRMIIVTQEYHQHRALYIANSLEIDALGAASDQRSYVGQSYREFREVLARDKDFLKALFKLQPKYSGEAIPVSGDSLLSHDQ